MYSSGYHRVSDDSVSSYFGHETVEAALLEALHNVVMNPDIDHTWVRDNYTICIWDSENDLSSGKAK